MALYLGRVTLSPEFFEAMIRYPEDRTDYIRSLVESLGGKLISLYYEVNGTHLFSLMEIPDEEDASAFGYAIYASGVFSDMESTKIMTSEEAIAAFRKASQISYRPPSGN